MNILQHLKTYIIQGKELPPTIQRWNRRIALAAALFLPGLPQILSRKKLVLAGLLFLLGTGALLNMAVAISLSNQEMQTFDLFCAVAIPNLSNAFPMRIRPEIAASQNLTPILAEEDLTFVQPHFRVIFTIHIILYVGCALSSVWYQRKIQSDALK